MMVYRWECRKCGKSFETLKTFGADVIQPSWNGKGAVKRPYVFCPVCNKKVTNLKGIDFRREETMS